MEIVDLQPSSKTGTTQKPGEVERDGNGRPKVIVTCDKCSGTGKVPSQKVEGRLNKCQTCKGEGRRLKAYSRMTTYIDCLEDKSNLTQWKQRNVAVGLSRAPSLLEAFSALPEPHAADRSQANALVQRAEEAAGSDLKALTGTALHDIVERINIGQDPGFIPPEHEDDIAAYRAAIEQAGIKVVAAETFVVNDTFGAAGTFDILGLHQGRLKIMDVKTGRIDYGLSKIGMQLGGYANSELYDRDTGERSPIQYTLEDGTVLDVDLDEALIIHLPAGQGTCTVVPVDIQGCYDGLVLAQQVRKWRSRKFQQEPLVTVDMASSA